MAAWPLRSSGTAHRPRAAPLGDAERPTARRRADRFGGWRDAFRRSARRGVRSGRCRRRPRCRRSRRPGPRSVTSCRATPNSPGFGRLRPGRQLGSPNARPAGLATSLRPAPIIISAIDRRSRRADRNARPPCRRAVSSRFAERDDLVQFVGDVEHRAAVGGELAQRFEQLLDFLRRQHRSRLVHDQQARIEEKRAHDLDALALADAQRRDDSARVETEPVFAEHLVDLGLELARRILRRGRARCSRTPSSLRTAKNAGTPCRCRAVARRADWR